MHVMDKRAHTGFHQTYTGLLELTLADPTDPAAAGPLEKKKAAKPGKPSLYHFK
jgi:hypothetical protein